MKVYILFALFALAVSSPLLGRCAMAPKYRPLYCFEGKVLPEDLPELQKLLEKYREGGDDHEFADYLGDMFDKKDIREGRKPNEEEEEEEPIRLGRCAQPPQSRPYECYAERVLRRDRKELKEAYDSLLESDLEGFNKVYLSLLDKRRKYYGLKEE